MKNLAKQQFGKLYVEDFAGRDKLGKALWRCLCECGAELVMRGDVITRFNKKGIDKSCGCAYIEAKWTGHEEISGCYWQAIYYHACQRDIEFGVTILEAWGKFIEQDRKCALSGVELSFVRNYRHRIKDQTASLDRIDNSVGYLPGNIQWVHKRVNRLKHAFSEEELIRWARLITQHNKEKFR